MVGESTASTLEHLVLILGCSVHPDGTPSRCLRRRVDAAIAWGQSLGAAAPGERPFGEVRFLAIGGAHPGRPAEAGVIERLLREAGVPGDAISSSPLGLNTIASLRACWPQLSAARNADRTRLVHVCTDAYHAPRCRLILALWGISSVAVPVPPTGLSRRLQFALRWRDRAALLEDMPLAVIWRAAGRLGP